MLKPKVLLLLTLLIVASVYIGQGGKSPGPWGRDAIALTILVTAFRLLDDLADADHDRHRHPERVICRTEFSTELRRVVNFLLALGTGLMLVFYSPWSLLLLAVVILMLDGWYSYRGRQQKPLRNAAVILAKYPAFLIMTGGDERIRSFPVAAGVYVLLLAAEWRSVSRLSQS